MSRHTAGFVILLALVAGLGTVALAQGAATGDRPECVTVTGSSRWNAAGYNHAVTVTNGCDYTVHCSVSTDVNPAVISVDLDAGQVRSVTTYLDAAGSGFVPHVDCAR